MSNADNERWKQKYLDLLEQQEADEQRIASKQDLLRRMLVRVSLAADGVDPEVDQILSELRDRLREGADDRLEGLLGRLEGAVLALDRRRSDLTQAQLEALQRIASQALALKPPREVASALKKLSKELKQQEGAPSLGMWHNLAQLQGEAVRALAPGEGGWLARLRGRPQLPAEAGGAAEAETRMAEVSLEEYPQLNAPLEGALEPGAEVVETAASMEGLPAFSKIGDTLSSQLLDLLRQMEIPELARDNAERARKKILKGLNWYELVAVLEDVSLVVLTSMELQRREFEGFLQALDERLNQAGLSLVAMHGAREQVTQHTMLLERDVQQQVRDLGQVLDEADELEQLKQNVRGKLDAILLAVNRFKAGSDAPQASLAEQLKALASRIELMEAESQHAQQALEQQRARLLRDVLTQLPNREAWQERQALEFERWQRYGRPLSLVVGDVDFFKRINDTYGHQAGDKVLRVIARTLAKRLRKTDFVARFGGEEFVFLLPETDAQSALATMEGLREAVSQCPFHFRDQPLAVTMSFGIAELCAGDTPEQAFERADKALYVAKQGGRNRCELG